jgi:hypothetical protein
MPLHQPLTQLLGGFTCMPLPPLASSCLHHLCPLSQGLNMSSQQQLHNIKVPPKGSQVQRGVAGAHLSAHFKTPTVTHHLHK